MKGGSAAGFSFHDQKRGAFGAFRCGGSPSTLAASRGGRVDSSGPSGVAGRRFLLALPGDRAFLIGLVCFLAAHVAYTAAFLAAAAPGAAVAVLPVGATSAAVYRWLRPHLGAMKTPVLACILVISAMLAAAANPLWAGRDLGPAAAMSFFGALAIYISDLFVARDRFVRTEIRNRFIGLPLYYKGQFLLAYATGMPGIG